MRRFHLWALAALLAFSPQIGLAAGPQKSGRLTVGDVRRSVLNLFKGNAKPAQQPQEAATDTKTLNTQTAERIAGALRGAGLSGYDIHIRFQKGQATIAGFVATETQKKRVSQVVQTVDGVRSVNNRLAIQATPKAKPAPRTQPAAANRPAPAIRKVQFANAKPAKPARPATKANPSTQNKLLNQRMAEKIAQALGRARLTSYDIEIRFRNGTAQLAGTVTTLQERAYAEQIAAKVPGVLKVENQLAMGKRPGQITPAAFQAPGATPPAGPQGAPMAAGPGIPGPPAYGHPGQRASHTVYNMPNMPDYAWPSYAAYPNFAQVSYPKEYSASAWPYIGPFYPYPQIPMGWRQAQLEWDDGHWSLNFRPRTGRWWWFLNPQNW